MLSVQSNFEKLKSELRSLSSSKDSFELKLKFDKERPDALTFEIIIISDSGKGKRTTFLLLEKYREFYIKEISKIMFSYVFGGLSIG